MLFFPNSAAVYSNLNTFKKKKVAYKDYFL